MEYPQGALSTIEEIEELVTRARAGEEVKLYSVSIGTGNPSVPDLTPVRVIEYDDSNRRGLRVRTNDDEECPHGKCAYIDLEWRGIPKEGIGTSQHHGFLFTNYWHAYAFSLRLTKKEVTSI